MRHSSKATVDSELIRKLETGDGSVKGLKLLLPVDGTALVPVEVIGINFGGYASRGVAVLVKPIGGHGTMSVEARELVDNTAEARKLYAAKSDAAQYLRDHTPRDNGTDKQWREAVSRERAGLTDANRKLFDAEAARHGREKQDALMVIKEASSYTLKDLFNKAVLFRFGVSGESIDED